MYIVAGSNIFTQWLPQDTILSEFTRLKSRPNFPLEEAQLFFMHWAYNIFAVEDKFYITGGIYGKESIRKLDLPETVDLSDLLITGNDKKIVAVRKSTCTLWVINLEKLDEFDKLNLCIEQPLEDAKRSKIEDSIIKISMRGESCLCLTERGHVYSGLLPSLVNTKHCHGKICDIACGYEHFIILTDAGNVYTWGDGGRLQLGHGDVSSVHTPAIVDALAGIKIVKIQAGGWHSMVLSATSDLYLWGWNDTGQVGIDETKARNSLLLPILINQFKKDKIELKVKDIACGSRHSAILLEDNSVWAAGYNKYGQLALSPEEYPTINKFMKVGEFKNDVELRCGPWNIVIISHE